MFSFVLLWKRVVPQYSRHIHCHKIWPLPPVSVSIPGWGNANASPGCQSPHWGEKKKRWMLSENGRSSENVCVLPGKWKRQSGREKLWADTERGEDERIDEGGGNNMGNSEEERKDATTLINDTHTQTHTRHILQSNKTGISLPVANISSLEGLWHSPKKASAILPWHLVFF